MLVLGRWCAPVSVKDSPYGIESSILSTNTWTPRYGIIGQYPMNYQRENTGSLLGYSILSCKQESVGSNPTTGTY